MNSTTINQINQIRPYRGYGVIESVNPIYSGNYNALQVAGRKQWKHDSLLQVNYTWSRALTNAAADRTGGPQISSNLAASTPGTALLRSGWRRGPDKGGNPGVGSQARVESGRGPRRSIGAAG